MDNKKYYYIRLKENFFDSNEIVLLESMQDGYLYSNILLKLYLRSLKDNGKLMFNDRIPYNPQMIATITRHQVGTVEKALKVFQEMGLIEILDNGAIFMLDIEQYIGKTSTEADRKKLYRKRVKEEKKLIGQKSGQMSDKHPPEIDIDLDINLDKEKNIYTPSVSNETHTSVSKPKKEKSIKHKYGEFQHVLLTDSEKEKLCNEYGSSETDAAIKYLDEAIEMKGYKYKSHYLAMKKWVFDAVKKDSNKNTYQSKKAAHTLSNGVETNNPFIAMLDGEK